MKFSLLDQGCVLSGCEIRQQWRANSQYRPSQRARLHRPPTNAMQAFRRLASTTSVMLPEHVDGLRRLTLQKSRISCQDMEPNTSRGCGISVRNSLAWEAVPQRPRRQRPLFYPGARKLPDRFRPTSPQPTPQAPTQDQPADPPSHSQARAGCAHPQGPAPARCGGAHHQ